MDTWVDAANVVLLEFGWGVGWLVVVALALMFVVVLGDGVLGVPGCMERRAARKKAHFVYNMKMVLREMGSDIKVERGPQEVAVKPEWPVQRPVRRIMQPVVNTKLKRLEVVKKSLEDKLEQQ